jgi:SAM-dependent methyltransferase
VTERRAPSGRRKLADLRLFLARAALVEEERNRRKEQVTAVESRLAERLDDTLHALGEELAQIRRENAAILRLLAGGEGNGDGPGERPSPDSMISLTRQSLFSEIERGSRAEVMTALEGYVPLFAKVDGPVVDLGCGRGEFLELALRDGVEAYGVDLDEDSVLGCLARGLDARREDLFEHLTWRPTQSLGGVFAAQVVEHLPAERLPELFSLAGRALRPGGVVVVETPNPATFATHIQSFWRDPTHVRPVPVAALSFAARTAGLVVQEVRFSSRPPEEERIQPIYDAPADPEGRRIVDAFNAMAERLNDFLYGYQDYALVVTKSD